MACAKALSNRAEGLHLCLISIHGLIRASDLELGRDADTGGQTKYVVELARALAAQPGVTKVELLTRLIEDPALSPDYSQPLEPLAHNAHIVRIAAGPPGYLPKEQLWDHLDNFVDNAIDYLRAQPSLPHLLHSHYADAGYVGSRLSHLLDLPLVHTGHSLGRVKRRRLLASGLTSSQVEERYNMTRRIEAEENTLASAVRVITSTHQEIAEQYELYDYYRPEQMEVIPPGTDLQRFQPPHGDERTTSIAAEVARFLREPEKPLILALSRADARKNIAALLAAYGDDPLLQQQANLLLIAGNRDDIRELDAAAAEVWSELLLLIDHYDLYGRVAYPKHHSADQVPQIYRLVAASRGVFVNPALTEPFGLTLIEAAASGLPTVATEDGGPRDILGNCRNGVLINPLDSSDIARGIREVLLDQRQWSRRAEAGLAGVTTHYSWPAHAQRYLQMVQPLVEYGAGPSRRDTAQRRAKPHLDRAIFTDLDQSLLSDTEALPALLKLLRENRKCAAFGIATGRRLDSALKLLKRHNIPEPDILITGGGCAIHYAPTLTEDTAWTRHIERQWTPQVVRRVLDGLPGLLLQPREEQGRFKISYYIDPRKAPPIEEIVQLLHQEEQAVNVIFSFGQYLDVLPLRASKGLALRYVAANWEIPLDHILVAGGSGADEDMMRGNTLAVVVGNRHHEELQGLEHAERVYFATASGAGGLLEAIDHYDFYDSCAVPSCEASA